MVAELVRVTTTGVGVGVPGRKVIGVGIPLGSGVGSGVGVSVGVGVRVGGRGEGVSVGVGVLDGVDVAVGEGAKLGVELGVDVSGGCVAAATAVDGAAVKEDGWAGPASNTLTATITSTSMTTSVSAPSHRFLDSSIVVGCPLPAPAASDATFYHEWSARLEERPEGEAPVRHPRPRRNRL